MRVITGDFVGEGLRIGIVVSRWNELITKQLLVGALDSLRRHGVAKEAITVVYVPGAFEIPLACRKLAERGNVDAVVALSGIISRTGVHSEDISTSLVNALSQAGMQTGVPCIFGLISAERIEQALELMGTNAGNAGFEAAQTAIEMARVLKAIGT